MQIYIKKATLQNDSAAFHQTYFRLWIIQHIHRHRLHHPHIHRLHQGNQVQ